MHKNVKFEVIIFIRSYMHATQWVLETFFSQLSMKYAINKKWIQAGKNCDISEF